MADTSTEHFGLIKPEVGGSDNSWGQKLHGNYDKLDGLLWQPRSNVLINGNFGVWQRGTSLSADGYSADRWRIVRGDGSHTVNRLQNGPGYHSPYCLGYERSAAATHETAFLSQRIEGVRTLNGNTVTVSFTAASRLATDKVVSVDFVQRFGTGGTPSALVDVANQTVTITPTATRFTLTFDIPPIDDKTIGTNGDDYLDFRFIEQSNFSTFSIWITDIQVEKGTFATPFERRHAAEELMCCQRYYQSFSGGRRGFIAGTATSNRYWLIEFPVEMRATPTVTGAVSSGTFNVSSRPHGLDVWTFVGDTTTLINLTNWTADAEL